MTAMTAYVMQAKEMDADNAKLSVATAIWIGYFR